jgi:ATP-dependent helicase/nuclease subunit B
MKGIFTIGIDRRFADELARGVLAEHAADPLTLADVLILVPTRRSVRALREAFLRAADGKPTILPRMAPLGDLDEGEWETLSGDPSALEQLPAIDAVEREALLAQLVAAFPGDDGQPIAQTAAQALKLARELASLLDELAIDNVPFEKLETLVDGNFAHHWRRTLKFLSIVARHGPRCWPSADRPTRWSAAPDRSTRKPNAGARRLPARRSSQPDRPARSPRRANC